MTADHTEKGFEDAIEASLLSHGGYVKGDAAAFNAALALHPQTLVGFLKDTQPNSWAKLVGFYGATVEEKVVQNVAKNLDQRGTLEVLRKGITDRGVKLHFAYFMPANTANPETVALYGKNVLAVTRQVHHSPTNPNHSIDLLLSLNGIPIATAELKNPFTGQTVVDAKKQYMERDQTDPLLRFKMRALVHFAVDPDLVFMTTKLAGKATFFLPLNKGEGGGAGNPINPTGYKTAYLWEQVWAKDSWMDILARFAHLQVEDVVKEGKTVRKESLIFPRYHQLDAVRRLIATAREEGAGHNYLIQHSAGSGKSNSIGWLAHRLANLHDDDDKLIFSSVIVITDRRVLDKQLQDNIFQFEHKNGVVEKIDQNSTQLGNALRDGKRIIITTLQKFPYVLGQVGDLSAKNFAIIADEAHSSQTGETATKLKAVLSAKSLDDAEQEEKDKDEDTEQAILDAMAARGRQKNLSFFAFTATPKKRTLEMFGRKPAPDAKPLPFHLYSMRQAIEEGFIHDVLRHYTTYKTFYKLNKAVEDDPEVDKKAAKRSLGRFLTLHPHNIAQRVTVMVEHFRQFTRPRIGGKAKAMVVTRSRLHALRYKREFDRYLAEHRYGDMKALVAFSGAVIDPEDGGSYSEPEINGFGEKELPDKFDTDDYQVLIVAEKYQTGFDQPLLHTMYVDKPLKGLSAVQTLSRLNRTSPGKEDTFVLDFANDAEDIKEAFKPYYEQTQIDEPTEPNQLYTLKNRLDGFQFYWRQEVEDFAAVFYRSKDKLTDKDQGLLHKSIDPAVKRFEDEPSEERQEDFRHSLSSYVRFYGFMSQIIDFADPDLEKLYAFARFLRSKLPQREKGDSLEIDDEVALGYYRLQKQFEGNASLTPGDTAEVTGAGDLGTGGLKTEDKSPLSEIIKVLNERFKTDFTEDDRLLFDQIVGDLMGDMKLTEQARNATIDQFRHVFDPKALTAMVKRIERNDGIASKLMQEEELRDIAFAIMMREVYERSRGVQAP